MKFDGLNYEELGNYVMSRLLFEEDESSQILKGHLFVEQVLEALISRNLAYPLGFFKRARSFELKLELALAMGLINKSYYSIFTALNKVRNNYAHKSDYKVTIAELNSFKYEWEEIQNKAFEAACTVSTGEAAKIATIFICWDAQYLISQEEE